MNIGELGSQLFTLYDTQERSSEGKERTHFWNRFNARFTAPFRAAEPGASTCGVTLPPGGQTPLCPVLGGGLAKLEGPVSHSPRAPHHTQASFAHLHNSPRSWEGAGRAARRGPNPDVFRQEGGEGWGFAPESWQREQEGKGGAYRVKHWSPCPARFF